MKLTNAATIKGTAVSKGRNISNIGTAIKAFPKTTLTDELRIAAIANV